MMVKKDFRYLDEDELYSGLTVWLDGRFLEEVHAIAPKPNDPCGPVCGPFLIGWIQDHRWWCPVDGALVELYDTDTSSQRQICCEWLLVPKEA